MRTFKQKTKNVLKTCRPIVMQNGKGLYTCPQKNQCNLRYSLNSISFYAKNRLTFDHVTLKSSLILDFWPCDHKLNQMVLSTPYDVPVYQVWMVLIILGRQYFTTFRVDWPLIFHHVTSRWIAMMYLCTKSS
jgi:hypothetical protein